jgi:hypothetical protein
MLTPAAGTREPRRLAPERSGGCGRVNGLRFVCVRDARKIMGVTKTSSTLAMREKTLIVSTGLDSIAECCDK